MINGIETIFDLLFEWSLKTGFTVYMTTHILKAGEKMKNIFFFGFCICLQKKMIFSSIVFFTKHKKMKRNVTCTVESIFLWSGLECKHFMTKYNNTMQG